MPLTIQDLKNAHCAICTAAIGSTPDDPDPICVLCMECIRTAVRGMSKTDAQAALANPAFVAQIIIAVRLTLDPIEGYADVVAFERLWTTDPPAARAAREA